jgi:hypothetical protein
MQVYKENHMLPLKPSHWEEKSNFQLKRVATKTQGFSMAKDHTPLETKANKKQALNPTKTPTPPEEENTRFHQFCLDKPQDKLWPLKQQSKSMLM